MQLRVECYGQEFDGLLAALRKGLNIASVSKPYPNMRGNAGTPCENRYYVKINENRPFLSGGDVSVTDLVTKDMLRFLQDFGSAMGFDPNSEIAGVRMFFDSADKLTDEQKFALMAEWRSALILKYVKRGVT